MRGVSGLEATNLYGRACKLVIGVPEDLLLGVDVAFNDDNSKGLDVSGLDFEFTVEKTLKPEPNTCEILVYNLSESSRKSMSGGHKLTVKLEAGYLGGTSLLYLGEVRAAWTEKKGPDFITHIESGDGEKEIAKNRIQVSRGAKVPIATAVQLIVEALGLGVGNVPQLTTTLLSKGIVTINSAALSGPAAGRLTDFCRSAQLEWSIQNGAIQILDIGKTISTQALEISSDTGMIDSPTADSDGILSFQTLIIPGLQPGVLVNMNSIFFKGGYRVERVKWQGQTFGNDWYASVQARKY